MSVGQSVSSVAKWQRPEYRERQREAAARRRAAVGTLEWFLAKIEPEPNSGCWLWCGGWLDTGYGNTSVEGARLAHRYSWTLFNGPVPAGFMVRHRCDVRVCVNPAHLELGDHAENMRDMTARGRADVRRGDRNTQARLTVDDVTEIRRQRSEGTTHAALADRFGVTRSAIQSIDAGRTWSHV